MHRSDHMIAIFGNHVTIAISNKMANDYQCVLCQIIIKTGVILRKFMASKVGVSPFKGQISENLSMLKVKVSHGCIYDS